MKPMKVVRRKRGGDNKKPVIIAIIIVLIIMILAVASFFVFTFLSQNSYSKTRKVIEEKNIEVQNGATVKATANEGDVCILKLPKDINAEDIKFRSTNESIAVVDDGGRVDALTEGQVMLDIKSKSFDGHCQLTIGKEEKENIVTSAYIANTDWVKKNSENDNKNLYMIQVNRKTNVVTVFTYNDMGKYEVPVRAMVCSCGKGGSNNTPTGNFRISSKYRWLHLDGDVYGQYVSQFNGDILFHSLPYKEQKVDSLKAEEFNKLGINASLGCVRLAVADTKWIYDNCDLDTEVNVIDDGDKKDVLGKPESIKVKSDAKWDPTDPDPDNPNNERMPTIEGAKDLALTKGNKVNLLEGITAMDSLKNDITKKVEVLGNVIFEKSGTYKVTYVVTDNIGKTVQQDIKVIIK